MNINKMMSGFEQAANNIAIFTKSVFKITLSTLALAALTGVVYGLVGKVFEQPHQKTQRESVRYTILEDQR